MTIEWLTFRCTHCSRLSNVRKNIEPIGKSLKCSKCQQIFLLSNDNLCEAPKVLTFHCPKCGEEIKVIEKEGIYGRQVTCQKCHHNFSLTEKRKDESNFFEKQELPTIINNRYRKISMVGKGAMGKVYAVFDNHLQKKVALKTLITKHTEESEKRFLREAKLTARLIHPNIVEIYDLGVIDEQYYFTMEYVFGILFTNVLQSSKYKRREILRMFVKLCYAIDYAHEKNIIHRDLKPDNIMVQQDGEPKIMDFGLSKMVGDSQRLTATGMIMGTITHMPPEQALGRIDEIDHRVDIYALGVILYTLLTDTIPFQGKTAYELLRQIVSEDAIEPHHLNPKIPQKISLICMKAIAKDKEDRYASAADLAMDLEEFL
ncbi:serine/threonine protein kinase [Candidatus Uabimicrobium amorphum]|uniref:non-specific serine/threonine protein kinase n=1 Tax=Uabimicrobium amorphum TaxID=2596890 RepID=A0A5S9IQ89_UABAM|nr:serine/threonine-protein kinase [Candidatus Uabimicrobium amorphum]BBM85462.1 protein kinase [Candidatus Uabimicrobium amorphum]